MKFYLSGRYDRRLEIAAVARHLRAHGHTVTSRWLDGNGMHDADNARYDLTDIVVAEAVVLFTEDPEVQAPFTARGGRHTEFGYALRAKKRLFLVGPRENIFHELEEVLQFDDAEELVHYFSNVEPPVREEEVLQ